MDARRLLLLVVGCCLVLPRSTTAQEDRSIFSVLDTQGRRIGPSPALAEGTLSETDVVSAGGRRVQVWALGASPGDEIQIDLRSDDFDAFLYLVGPGLGEGLRDDDGGNGLDSRLCMAVTEAGEYRVVASSLNGDMGDFTLEVRERSGAGQGVCSEEGEDAEITDLSELPTDSRTLRVGDDVEGTLTSADPIVFQRPAQAWAVAGQAGARFSVDLLSDDFDAYLMLEGPGLDTWLEDDDGAGRCDSRITLTFPESGTYRVVASALGETAGGGFRLVASEMPGPEDPNFCVPPDTSVDVVGSFEDISVVGGLQPEVTQEGVMTGGEGQFESRYLQGWMLEGEAGSTLAIEMRSDDFDAYLYLAGPGFPEPIYDDDSAGGLDSRICVELPETAIYRVLAGPLSGSNEGGTYTLRATRNGLDALCDTYDISPAAVGGMLAGLSTEGRNISVGQELEGFMDVPGIRHPETDHLIQPWSLEATAGQSVFIDVVSAEFDPVLYVVGPGIDEPLFVDDAGDGCNSRLTLTPSVSGTFQLLPGSYSGGGGGYLLRVSTDPPTLESGGCGGFDAGGTAGGGGGLAAAAGALAGISSGESRRMDVGTEVTGSLGFGDEVLVTGEPAQAWTIELTAGDEFVFELLSDDFDSVLYLDDGSPLGALMDDDGAGNLDSRIVYTAATRGIVRLVAT
ncbi:MAG: hypothetical protein O7J95_17425, partial [Planctomycetota bacterium]|nr:hypothetical protein [Planctomycetota bacterium]